MKKFLVVFLSIFLFANAVNAQVINFPIKKASKIFLNDGTTIQNHVDSNWKHGLIDPTGHNGKFLKANPLGYYEFGTVPGDGNTASIELTNEVAINSGDNTNYNLSEIFDFNTFQVFVNGLNYKKSLYSLANVDSKTKITFVTPLYSSDEVSIIRTYGNIAQDMSHTKLVDINLDTNYLHSTSAEKANYLTGYNHSLITDSNPHLTKFNQLLDTSDVALKSGSLTQITTRNHNDLQNLNATSAHPSASIDNTSTSYGKGLATTDNTVQKIADRVNQNGTPAFKTSKDKCSLMLNFKDGLADSTNAIVPIGYNTATKNKADNFISNPDGSISATLKQFEGDEGKFGSGVAVEESRTNLLLYSDDLTNAAWTKNNCNITLDRVLPDGRKLFKITVNTTADASITQPITLGNQAYSFQAFMQYTNKTYSWSFYNADIGAILFVNKLNDTVNALTKFTGTNTPSAAKTGVIQMYIANPTAGDTFYITSPQLEAGSFPTSYIATGSTAVTRPTGKLPFDPKLINPKLGSISLWYKPNYKFDLATAASEELFEIDTGSYNDILYCEYTNASDCFMLRSTSAANSNSITTSAYTAETFNDKTFHIVCKWDATNIYLYVNGVLIGSALNYNVNNAFARFCIGQLYHTPGYEAQGTISNFEIFNYALTADEIANIYNAGLEGKPVELDNGKTVSEADRLSPNINAGSNKAQFVTDKTKCSLLLDFKGTLADKTRAINPIGSDAANKWTDNFVNDSTTKANATNISCTLKQFDGDEGLFGSGIAVEESRTNLLLYSDDLANSSAWCYVNLAGVPQIYSYLPDGRKLWKITSAAAGECGLYQVKNISGSHTLSAYINNPEGLDLRFTCQNQYDFLYDLTDVKKITRKSGTATASSGGVYYGFRFNATAAGQSYYITSPQLEAGAFPTSYIATGATAVTRPAGKINFDPNILNGKTDFTISVWAKPNFNYDSYYQSLFFLSNNDDSKTWTLFYNATKDSFQARFGAVDDAYEVLSSSYTNNTDLQKWHHFVLKQVSNVGYLYINGILIGTSSAMPVDITKFSLDCHTNAPPLFSNTTISNFAIFNYALSDAEISQIYNSGLEGKPIAITNPESIIGVGQTLHDPNFITFTSGWGISSTYPNKPTLSKSSNVALMRGILEYSGVVNSDVTIFTLPVGARPSLPDTYYHSFVATARDSGSPAMRILRVYGNGDVKLMASGATITNPAIALDGINFINGK